MANHVAIFLFRRISNCCSNWYYPQREEGEGGFVKHEIDAQKGEGDNLEFELDIVSKMLGCDHRNLIANRSPIPQASKEELMDRDGIIYETGAIKVLNDDLMGRTFLGLINLHMWGKLVASFERRKSKKHSVLSEYGKRKIQWEDVLSMHNEVDRADFSKKKTQSRLKDH